MLDDIARIGANYVRVLSHWTPAVEKPFAGKTGKDGDEWDAAGGGDMLSGGIIADVEARASDDTSETGEGAFVEKGRAGGGAFHSFGFFASCAFIDPQVQAGLR